jgi:DNA-binding Lrp family transcriptional regulator
VILVPVEFFLLHVCPFSPNLHAQTPETGRLNMKNAGIPPRAHAFATVEALKLNARDRAILEILETDAEANAARIGQIARIPADGVRRRLAALRKRGVVQNVWLINRRFTGFSVRAMISIDLDPPELRSKKFGYSNQQTFCVFVRNGLAKRTEFRGFTTRVRVDSISIVLGGRCDLVAFVVAPDPDAICDFVTRVLRFLPGVQNTNTAMVF